MANMEAKSELDKLRKIANKYTEMAGDLAHMVDDIETELDENRSVEYAHCFVQNQSLLRERVLEHVYSDLSRQEADCWFCLINSLKPDEEES